MKIKDLIKTLSQDTRLDLWDVDNHTECKCTVGGFISDDKLERYVIGIAPSNGELFITYSQFKEMMTY